MPLTALTASADQKHLILNADKAKVEAAMGFDRNNWPSVNNPSWGAEPFWQKETGKPAVSDQPAKDAGRYRETGHGAGNEAGHETGQGPGVADQTWSMSRSRSMDPEANSDMNADRWE